MKKKLLLSTVAAVTVLSSSMSVCAAPQYMADGEVFDPEWYLEQNQDLSAAFGRDASADTLYQHYTLFGAGEGRTPYDLAHFDLASVLPNQGTDAAMPQQAETAPQPAAATSSQLPVILMQDGKQLTDERTIMAVEGESYPLKWENGVKWRDWLDDLIGVTFQYIPQERMDAAIKAKLASNTLPGYEWRQVQVSFAIDPKTTDLIADSTLYVDGSFGWDSSARTMNFDRDSTAAWNIFQEASFTVNYNGVDYPGCAFCTSGRIVGGSEGNDVNTTLQTFVLVPEGYSGSMSLIVHGCASKIRFDF